MRALIVSFCLLFSLTAFAQSNYRYRGRLEANALQQISAQPAQNGLSASFINGISYKKMLYAGIGLGFVQYRMPDNITSSGSDIQLFLDLEYRPLTGKITPLINFKTGNGLTSNSHYASDIGSALFNSYEITAGIDYKLRPRLDIYLKTGFAFDGYSTYMPITAGIGF